MAITSKRFVTYDLALKLYRKLEGLEARASLKDQLLRAAESVALNLAEGSGRQTTKDQARFYGIALGSMREVQAALDLMNHQEAELRDLADHVAACLFRLIHPKPAR